MNINFKYNLYDCNNLSYIDNNNKNYLYLLFIHPKKEDTNNIENYYNNIKCNNIEEFNKCLNYYMLNKIDINLLRKKIITDINNNYNLFIIKIKLGDNYISDSTNNNNYYKIIINDDILDENSNVKQIFYNLNRNTFLAGINIKINIVDYFVKNEGDDENDYYFCDNFCKVNKNYDFIEIGNYSINNKANNILHFNNKFNNEDFTLFSIIVNIMCLSNYSKFYEKTELVNFVKNIICDSLN